MELPYGFLDDVNLVQHIAEVIIHNASADSERKDFWSKAEKNLLMALIHYVQSLISRILISWLPPETQFWEPYTVCSTSVAEMDARFRAALPPGHPALPLTAFFVRRLTIFGEISPVGLGSRLNMSKNKLADSIEI